jgi:hypothetical protein
MDLIYDCFIANIRIIPLYNGVDNYDDSSELI